jgi:hypothetical protein
MLRSSDVYDEAKGAAYEIKTGYVSGSSALEQIRKDAAALANKQVNSVEWVFLSSRTGGRWGPSKTILQALDNAGIPYAFAFAP